MFFLSIDVGAFEENLRTAHTVEELLGLSAVGFELLARHLQRVDLYIGMGEGKEKEKEEKNSQ